jgi:hypothetical protein
MANSLRPRSSNVFSGLFLIFIGALLLLHTYRGFELGSILWHWWPLLLIIWGLIKIYERMVGARHGETGAGRVTGGEVFLVLGLLCLVGLISAGESFRENFPGLGIDLGNSTSFDLDVAPKAVPANARISIRDAHGDITIRATDTTQIRVSGKKNVRSWSDSSAKTFADKTSVEIVQNGDGYEVRTAGVSTADSRVSVDMEVEVPKTASLTVRDERGDISISDVANSLDINQQHGDVEVRDTGGDVSIDCRHGDTKVSDTKGNVKISGAGDSIEVGNAGGGLTINGEFVGPIRANKIAKGVRFVSRRTDMTINKLNGHMEVTSGNLEVVDAPGDLTVRTQDDISIDNVTGRLKIDNRKGSVEVHFSAPPKEDIEINNDSAGITLSMPEASSFQISADCHSGDIDSEFSSDTLKKTSTDSGDSHLEGSYGKAGKPKIALRTSYDSINLHKTN